MLGEPNRRGFGVGPLDHDDIGLPGAEPKPGTGARALDFSAFRQHPGARCDEHGVAESCATDRRGDALGVVGEGAAEEKQAPASFRSAP